MIMDNPGNKDMIIHSLAATAGRKVTGVTRLGYNGNLEWKQDDQGLKVVMSDVRPGDHVVVLKIQ